MTDQEYTEYLELMHVLSFEPHTKEELERIKKDNRPMMEVIIEEEDKRFLDEISKRINNE